MSFADPLLNPTTLMKKHSDEVLEREHENALRFDPEAKSFRLTGFEWRDAPQWMLGVAAALLLVTGLNLGRAALFTKDLLVDEGRPDMQRELTIVEEGLALSKALTQAMEEGDPGAVERCRKNLDAFDERGKQRQAREVQRLAEHENAEQSLRQRYGAVAAGLIVGGLVLAGVARSLGRRGHRPLAEPTDAVDAR